jgi:hypothetical protein
MKNKTDPRVNDTPTGDKIVRTSMKCAGHNELLSLDHFHASDVKSGRKSSNCKECKKKIYHERDYNKKGVERKRKDPKRQEKDRARYQRRKDKILAKNKLPENRLKRRLSRYGLTVNQYEELLTRSRGLCETGCGKIATDIDHCHQTKVVRGLLCNPCNQALGYLQDSPAKVSGLFSYINTRTTR